MAHFDEDLSAALRDPIGPQQPDVTAQVIASGPSVQHAPMPETFESLTHAARRKR